MGTSLAFKITASAVKPTRETLLDYCSYVILILSFIAIVRVWISGGSWMEDCGIKPYSEMGAFFPTKTDAHRAENQSTDAYHYETAISQDSALRNSSEDLRNDNAYISTAYVFSNDSNHVKGWLRTVTEEPVEGSTAVQHVTITSHSNAAIDSCPKYYQATFAYVLLIEALIQLFLGLLWAKVPKVSHTLNRFTEIIRECQACDWAKKAMNIVTDKNAVSDVSQSLYSIMSGESVNYDMRSFLDALFHPDNDYQSKSKARHLYETVQTFSERHSEQSDIWMTYVIKSIVQFIWWILIFTVNLVLFVMLEFYVVCPDDINVPCNHDTFLRIIWFMGESMLFVYGMFVCKTLKWVNEKSVVHQSICAGFTRRCCPGGTRYGSADTGPLLKCKAYRFVSHLPVYNDMAVMLHLLEEAHPKVVPYFAIFMFDEWKEKLTSFPDPDLSSGYPVSSSMRMLSGRPPPIIEITDISMHDVSTTVLPHPSAKPSNEESHKEKRRPSVRFFIEGDLNDSYRGKDAGNVVHGARTGTSSSENAEFKSQNMVHLSPPKSSPSSQRHLHRQLSIDNDIDPLMQSDGTTEQDRRERCHDDMRPRADFGRSGAAFVSERIAETDALVIVSSSDSEDSAKEKNLSYRDSEAVTASETQRLLYG